MSLAVRLVAYAQLHPTVCRTPPSPWIVRKDTIVRNQLNLPTSSLVLRAHLVRPCEVHQFLFVNHAFLEKYVLALVLQLQMVTVLRGTFARQVHQAFFLETVRQETFVLRDSIVLLVRRLQFHVPRGRILHHRAMS